MVFQISGRGGDQIFEKENKLKHLLLNVLYSEIMLGWKQWKFSNFDEDFLCFFFEGLGIHEIFLKSCCRH